MKLYPLIFTNEAARTAEESSDMGIAAMGVKLSADTPARIVLFSKKRAIKEVDKIQQVANDDKSFADLAKSLGNRAIVGAVGYEPVVGVDDLYQVTTSAGVNKFGPLAYQIAMRGIRGSDSQPGWLKSDSSLTDSSANVWNEMYKRPQQYDRKWLGSFGFRAESMVRRAMSATESSRILFRKFSYERDAINEQEVLKFLQENNETIENFGYLYAYRIKSVDPKIQNMFDLGEEFLTEMENKGYTEEKIRKLINDSSMLFFNRRYR
jgi:hypothetical protein